MSKELIEAFSEYLTVNKALSKNSISAYLRDIEQFANFSKIELLKRDSSNVIEFLSTFKNARTINRKLASINTFYNFVKELEFGLVDIKLQSSKIPATLPKYLSYEEIIEATNNIPIKSWIDLRDIALILFLYATGVRVSEAVNTSRDDIDGGWLRVRYAKGEKERVVPIAKTALNAIELYLKERSDLEAPLFVNYKKTPLSRVSMFKITKKYLSVSPHVLRHSYASSLILGGADLRVVQELLGHSSLLTTQIYTHIQKPHLKETINYYHPLSQEKR
jgi:integrase/recombinase XerD